MKKIKPQPKYNTPVYKKEVRKRTLQNFTSKLSNLCSRCQCLDHKGKYEIIKIHKNVILDIFTNFFDYYQSS